MLRWHPWSFSRTVSIPQAQINFVRHKSQLAPRNVKYIKRQKGVIPIPTGGSTKGTTLAFGDYGIRVRGNGGRLSADHLTVAEDVIKRVLKVQKGAKIYMRVFPNIPVSVKVRVVCLQKVQLNSRKIKTCATLLHTRNTSKPSPLVPSPCIHWITTGVNRHNDQLAFITFNGG